MGIVRLALVRHAPTQWNADKRLQGRQDVPLSAAGLAMLAQKHLPDVVRSWPVYSSPLLRARQTAAHFAPQGYIVDDRLIEMDWGEWEGRRLADLRAADPDAMRQQEVLGLDLLPPGGESPRQVQGRVLPFCQEMAASGQSAVVVTHKGVIRAMIALADGWDMKQDYVPKIDHRAGHYIDLDRDGQFVGVRLNQF